MEIVFCERCGVSIPEHQVVGVRQASDGRDLCATCSGPGAVDGDLPLYFCENCSVSIAVSEVITGQARTEGTGYLCGVCARSSPAERSARRTAVERELSRGVSAAEAVAATAAPRTPDAGLVLYFCEGCNASVPAAQVASGRALVRGGRTWCVSCRVRVEAEGVSAPASAGFVPVLAAALLASAATAAGFLAFEGGKAEDEAKARARVTGELEALRSEIRRERLSDAAARDSLQAALGGPLTTLERDLGVVRADARAAREGSERLAAVLGTDRPDRPDRLAVLEGRVGSVEGQMRERFADLEKRIEVQLAAALEQVRLAAEDAAMSGSGGTDPGAGSTSGGGSTDTPPSPDATGPPAGLDDQTQKVIALLKDLDAGVRFSAAIELGKLGNRAVWKALVEALKKDDDVFVRRACVRSLGELKAYDAFPDLVEALTDSEEYVAKQASMVVKEMAGQDFGYKQSQSKSDRKRVAERAGKWWEDNRDRLAPGSTTK